MTDVLHSLDPKLEPFGLIRMGYVRDGENSVILIGTGPTFWPIFTKSEEYLDGAPHPLDRWSTRVLGQLRDTVPNALDVVFPFGGPPYTPFLRWATESGEAWQSPVGMMVHDQAGLMISYRGGIVIKGNLPPPKTATAPCTTCAAPCQTACPVNALSAETGYNVDACHAFLDTSDGQDCLTNGCKARRACPVSQRFGRDPAQSAFHMKSFHPS